MTCSYRSVLHGAPVLLATADSQVADNEDLSSRPFGGAAEGGNSLRGLGAPMSTEKSGPVTAPFVKFRAAQLRGLVQQICHSPCDTRISLAHEGTAFFHSPTASRSNFNAETVQCSASWQVTPECLLVNPATETHTAIPEAHSKTCLRMQLHIESAHSLRTFVIHCSAA